MHRTIILILCLLLTSVAIALAEADIPSGSDGPNAPSAPGDTAAKLVRGMSILGNNEAPMSLFIVPWKTSELGAETSLQRTLNERDVPVDRDVFLRELDYYQVSVGDRTK